jgi:hypothetical protein
MTGSLFSLVPNIVTAEDWQVKNYSKNKPHPAQHNFLRDLLSPDFRLFTNTSHHAEGRVDPKVLAL